MSDDRPALSRATVDRAAHRRRDLDWLATAWADPASRVLRVDAAGRTAVRETDAGPRLAFVAPADAGDGDRLFLGEAGGVTYLAEVATDQLTGGDRLAGLREVGSLLTDTEAGLLVHAVGVANWHRSHPHCSRCGALTVAAEGGHTRVCTVDGSSHFPRSDPAAIMLVHDGGDRALLGRQAIWPPNRFSTLAGFVEPGESAEQGVAREVLEEVGVRVTDVVYVASQPWPFPASLMLGFTARALDEELTIATDEIEDARWFTREQVLRREVLLPPPVSVAYRLISHWLGEPAPVDPGW